MTVRHLFGGNVRLVGTIAALGACLVIPMLIGGCGGGDDWDDDYYDPEPRYHDLTIILNVSDFAGDALGEVTVWVDQVAQSGKTSWQFVELDRNYPEEWRGFAANWIQTGFSVATYGPGDWVEIDVMVTKPGYYPQVTTFTVENYLPIDVYARDTFVMEPSVNPADASELRPKRKDKPGEVIGWEKKAGSAAAGSEAKQKDEPGQVIGGRRAKTSQTSSMFKIAAETEPSGYTG